MHKHPVFPAAQQVYGLLDVLPVQGLAITKVRDFGHS